MGGCVARLAVVVASLASAGGCGDPPAAPPADGNAASHAGPAPARVPRPRVRPGLASGDEGTPATSGGDATAGNRATGTVTFDEVFARAGADLTDAEIAAFAASPPKDDYRLLDDFFKRLVAERRERLPEFFGHTEVPVAVRAIHWAWPTPDSWPELPALVSVLDGEPRRDVVTSAIAALTSSNAARERATPYAAHLEALLWRDDPEIVRSAAAHLGLLGTASEAALGRFAEFIARSDAVRYETVRALMQVDAGRRDVVERLAEVALGSAVLDMPAHAVQAESNRAVVALGRNGRAAPDVAVPALERVAAGGGARRRVSALAGLARLGSETDARLDGLRAIADDASAPDRTEAIVALAEFCRPVDAARFESGLESSDGWCIARSARALATLTEAWPAGADRRNSAALAWKAVVKETHADVLRMLLEALPALLPPGDRQALFAACEAVHRRVGHEHIDVVIAARRAMATLESR